MKISLLKEPFLEKLNYALKFTSSRLTSSTSLQGVCLVGKKEEIDFFSTNLNFYYHTKLKIKEGEEFKIVVEAKKISEFLSLLSSGKIDLEISEKKIVISQEKTKAEFPLFESSEFPFPPTIKNERQKITSHFLKNNLPLVSFSASSDDTRPVLTGINFVSKDEEMQIVATDGFRLSLLTTKKDLNLPSSIIPSSFLEEIIKLIKDEKEAEFSYSPEEKMLVFYIGEHELFTRLIEGDFPPYERVIPTEKKTTVIADRDELLRSVKLVSIFARDLSNVVIFETDKDTLKIYPKTGSNEDNITYQDAQIEGEKQKIAFNYKFVIDFLTNINSKKIIIELLRGDAPAVFKGEEGKNFLHIIMPVRIQE